MVMCMESREEVDESVDGDVQDGDVEEASTTKMFPATARSKGGPCLVSRSPFTSEPAPSQSKPLLRNMLTGSRLSPMPFRHKPSPQ